ncbi:hypothetical protein ACFPN1_03205 [Lysobacter yangpyeongensis]|uniref:Uncharacterized protein n=1 Tax=Lysobacter yangpyeongensis TaxID=346182 RepID=A0ABW0SK25_9GAMM
MAGFFRQLAQRVHAPAARLHSSAALPYSGARDTPGDADADTWPAALPDTSRSLRVDVSNHIAPARPAGNTPAKSPSSRRDGTKRSRATTNPVRARSKPSPRPAERERRTPRSIVEQVVALMPALAPRPPVAPSIAAARPAAASTAPPGAAQPSVPATRRRHKAPMGTSARAASATRTKSIVAPRRQMPPAAPDVHIHIGRVELTAGSTAPAAPRRESPAERRPMSLDDYLRQRRAGRTGSP